VRLGRPWLQIHYLQFFNAKDTKAWKLAVPGGGEGGTYSAHSANIAHNQMMEES
jgi:hypothetical protein